MLEADAGADVDECQVVVEYVGAKRHDDHKPTGQDEGDEKEPAEAGGAEVPPGAGVEPADA